MAQYFDRHRREIVAGMDIRCLLNGEIVTVHEHGGDLVLLGDRLGGLPRGCHSLISFSPACDPGDSHTLPDFEIVEKPL